MKRFLLLLFVSIFCMTAQAQFSIDHTEVTTAGNISEDDIAAHARLRNGATTGKTFIWTREEVVMEDGWTSAVCDTNQCYLPFVSTRDFDLNGGESADVIMHLYPDGIAGEGEIKLTLEEENGNPADNLEITFFFTVSDSTTGLDSPENFAVSIFPNPTNDYIALSENEVVKEITIYNILGTPMKQFNVRDGLRYDISDLSSGMYLVGLRDFKGQIVKTIRVSKR